MAFDLNYYKQKLAGLEERRNKLMRSGKYKLSMNLNKEIEEIRKLIEEAEPRPATEMFTHEQLSESGLVIAVLETHLAADYLAACCYTIEDIVRKLGAQAVTVIPELKEMIDKANSFCGFLYGKEPYLRAIIEDDETLMQAIHKKTMSYIKQRLTKRKPRKS